ncbi:MAG: serine protease [Clostridiales bacterium]|nr:serine protease [Clostridiales bacterium]
MSGEDITQELDKPETEVQAEPALASVERKERRLKVIGNAALALFLLAFSALFVLGYLVFKDYQREMAASLQELQEKLDSAVQHAETLHREQGEAFTNALEETATGLSAAVNGLSERVDDLDGSLFAVGSAFQDYENEPRQLHELLRATVYLIESGNASGSCFMISADGLFATNEHVVSALNMKKAVITDSDGNEYTDIEVVAKDKLNDVAIIRVNGIENAKHLALSPWLSDAEYTQLIGTRLYTMGYPYGLYSFASGEVCSGIEDRPYGGHREYRAFKFSNFAAPGSSGSPLVDGNGTVIGIVSSVYGRFGYPLISFAGSLNPLLDLLESLKETGG